MILSALLDECLDPSCECSVKATFMFFSPLLNVLCYICVNLNELQFIRVETVKLNNDMHYKILLSILPVSSCPINFNDR